MTLQYKIIAVLVALLSYVGVALYGVSIGKEQCKNAVATKIMKGVEQDAKISKDIGRMPVSELDRSLDFWMRD